MPTPSVDSNSGRFRHRKISVKQKLRIYRPIDLKDLDRDELQQRELIDIETGVEKNEEKEEHLHKILQKNQLSKSSKDLYIPTPDASKTWCEFEKFYYGKFNEPKSYIQFSAQIEDCSNPNYNMDENDELFLEGLNANLEDKLTEDEFEMLFSNFESTIQDRQPFLSMDPVSLLSYEELKPTMLKNDIGDIGIKTYLSKQLKLNANQNFVTKFDSPTCFKYRHMSVLVDQYGSQIYQYWKQKKIDAFGKPLLPSLKIERIGNDKDDNDPYVCFRRRELRQIRKTRRIDIQNSQKLRLLYQQLLYTKELALLVAKREKLSLDMILKDKEIFKLRCEIKPIKRSLNIQGDEEDLINLKKMKVIANVITQKKHVLSNHDNLINGRKLKSSKSKQRHIISNKQASSNELVRRTQIQQQHKSVQQKQNQQQENSVSSHVYVKLPSSKIPDIALEDVDKILTSKERSTRKFVEDKMRKRRQEDGDLFFNLTDDPYNPVFEMLIPKVLDSESAPFSSIASSEFQVDKSYYVPNIEDYIEGNTNNISVYNKSGELMDNSRYKKIEFFNPFQNNCEIYSKEFPLRFRKRVSRFGIEYWDRKQVCHSPSELISEFLNLDSITHQENSNDVINVYDSKLDELSRIYDKWKFDSSYNSYGHKFSDEPARLNQISNDTQVIRFGTMLGTKSYEQLRDTTMKHRQDIMRRKKIVNSSQHNQLQQSISQTNSNKNGFATKGGNESHSSSIPSTPTSTKKVSVRPTSTK